LEDSMNTNSVGSVFSLSLEQRNYYTEERLHPKEPCPQSNWGCSSHTGFLAPDEDLLECCKADRQTLNERKVTYETIAKRLVEICNIGAKVGPNQLIEGKFKVGSKGPYNNYQFCPFTTSSDEMASPFAPIPNACGRGRGDFTIANVVSGRSIEFSDLLTHMIFDHHFFEGRVSHRLDPINIIETLELIPDPNFIEYEIVS